MLDDGEDSPPTVCLTGSVPVMVRQPSDHRIPQIHRISAEITENALRNGPQLRTKAQGHFIQYRISLTSEAHASHPQCQWVIWKRYSEFERLRKELIAIDKAYGDVPFPGKSMFWNTAASVAKNRMGPLAQWLNATMQNPRGFELDEYVGARVAETMDAFLEFSTHSQPPKASDKSASQDDLFNHYTNPDLKFVSTIKRADSMADWKKHLKSDNSPKVGRSQSHELPVDLTSDDDLPDSGGRSKSESLAQ